MWFSRLFSGRKGKDYTKNFLPSASTSTLASPYHYGGCGDNRNEELPSAKAIGGLTPQHFKGSGDFKKGQSPGFASDFTVKDSTAYDFLWTIKSFSKLVVDNQNRQTSGRFESKGYTWKLVLYPNGNIVNGQISLYLMLSKLGSHTGDPTFKVSYELFLFDQNTGATLSEKGENLGQIQDEMGFRGLIDLKTFKDSANGYLVTDTCMFGVKIMNIVPIQTPTECLQPVEKVCHEYTWKIENFSKLEKRTSHEKKFTAGDYLWSIIIHPEGDHKSEIMVKDNNVSLYMYYHGSIYDTSAMKVSAEFTLSINDQIEGHHKKRTYTEVFKCGHPGWGRKDFIPIKNFNDPSLGFLVNDTCIIEVKVAVLALVK